MPLRDYFSVNFWWKVLSLGLAVLIWFAVNFGIHPDSATGLGANFAKGSREFVHQPITVMAVASDTRSFRVAPSEVTVKVLGDQAILDNLRPADIEVYVNLVVLKEARVFRKHIQVYAPAGVTVSRIEPEDVLVERLESAPPIRPGPRDVELMQETRKKIFGTDGVRGKANVEPVTAETALKLGRAAAHVFKNLESQSRGRGRHKIVIGKDTRLSGYMLENALSSGILSMGVDVLFIGPLPTPGVAYVTRSLRADAGIVITASHNPYDDNGIKFFRADGYKLDDNIEAAIEGLVFSGEIENIRPTAGAIGKAIRIDDALGRYIEYAKASFPKRLTLEGIKIVADCAHGAAYKSTPCVLRELGAEVIVFGDKPDGTNINKECGSMHPEHLSKQVRKFGADFGLAHDGDADRVLLVDDTGTLVDGDDIMAIATLEMLRQGTLRERTLVTTVMSNAGLDRVIQAAGGRLIRTAVGDKNVIDEMLKGGYNFGGEQSGHLIFGDFGTTGDGLVAALQILHIMKVKQEPLSRLRKCWKRYPQLVTNLVVSEKRPFAELPGILPLVAQAETALQKEGGRVLLRYSGTEPKARLLLEGPTKAILQKWNDRIMALLQKHIGV